MILWWLGPNKGWTDQTKRTKEIKNWKMSSISQMVGSREFSENVERYGEKKTIWHFVLPFILKLSFVLVIKNYKRTEKILKKTKRFLCWLLPKDNTQNKIKWERLVSLFVFFFLFLFYPTQLFTVIFLTGCVLGSSVAFLLLVFWNTFTLIL